MAPTKKAATPRNHKKSGTAPVKAGSTRPAGKKPGRAAPAAKARPASKNKAASKSPGARPSTAKRATAKSATTKSATAKPSSAKPAARKSGASSPKQGKKAAPKAAKVATSKTAAKTTRKVTKPKATKKVAARRPASSPARKTQSKPTSSGPRTAHPARPAGPAEAAGITEPKSTPIPRHDDPSSVAHMDLNEGPADTMHAPSASDRPAPVRVARGTGASERISSRDLAIELARLASDDKCTDIVLLDVRGLSPISDYVIVASGTSDRQMRAVADHAEDLGAQLGHTAFRSSKDPRALWLLIDFSDVVLHVFEPNTRAHYDIEMMWGDAKRLPWERNAQDSRTRQGPAPALGAR